MNLSSDSEVFISSFLGATTDRFSLLSKLPKHILASDSLSEIKKKNNTQQSQNGVQN
jgi:hypothetical protein